METEFKKLIDNQKQKDSITSDRKLAHLQICLENDVQAKNATTGLEDISLIHCATTDLNFNEIDLSIEIFGKKIELPLIISGMTGGHAFAHKLNHFLSKAVNDTKIGMGVGSQRAALEDDEVRESFEIVRKNAPDSLMIGNIGAGQIALDLTSTEFQKLIDMIKADAIAIHFNPLQESIQPEGDIELKGLHEKTQSLISEFNIPIVAKEVGSGFSVKDIKNIQKMGFAAVDTQGVGGTSWAGVESIRTISPKHKEAGEIFWDWGITTAISTILAEKHFKGTIIGSGGVRTGLDIAKLISIGANVAGMAIPFLFSVQKHSAENVVEFIREIEYQIRLACFLTGSRNLSDLSRTPVLIEGKTAERMRNYGIDPSDYLHRKK
jgi:isopentenyl-diphosphate delta-isomerase